MAQQPNAQSDPQRVVMQIAHQLAQKLGQEYLRNLNQNPPPEIRDLATKQGLPPAQAYLRHQALALFRRSQQAAQPVTAGAPPQEQQTPRPMPGGVAVGMAPPDMMKTAQEYEAQQAEAKKRASTGAEVVPVSQNSRSDFPPGSMAPGNIGNLTPQAQLGQYRNVALGPAQAQAHAAQFQRPSPGQVLQHPNQPLTPAATPQQRPLYTPQHQNQQQIEMQRASMGNMVQRPIPTSFENYPAQPLQLQQPYPGHLKVAQSQQKPVAVVMPTGAASTNISRPQSAQQKIPTPPQHPTQKSMAQSFTQQPSQPPQPPQPANTIPTPNALQQGKAFQVGPNFVLDPDQIAIMDARDAPRPMLGSTIPTHVKTWGQVKQYMASINAPPHVLDMLRSRQAQHYQFLANAQSMGRVQSSAQLPPTITQQPQAPPGPIGIQQKPAGEPPMLSLTNIQHMSPAQLIHLQNLASQGRLPPHGQQTLQSHIYQLKQLQEQQRARGQYAPGGPSGGAPQAPLTAPQPPGQTTPAHRPPQQPGPEDSPSAQKKPKMSESEDEVTVVEKEPPQRRSVNRPKQPTSQFPVQPPQVPKPGVPQQAPAAQPAVAGRGQTSSAVAPEAPPARPLPTGTGQPEKQSTQEILSALVKLLKEEQSSHKSRQILQLTQGEKEQLRLQLSDAQTKNMIRRIDQLLPMVALLNGDAKSTRELIRTVLLAIPRTFIPL